MLTGGAVIYTFNGTSLKSGWPQPGPSINFSADNGDNTITCDNVVVATGTILNDDTMATPGHYAGTTSQNE